MLKYKKLWLMLLSLICLIGVAILVVIGVKRTSQSDLVEGLESLGLKTFEAYDAKPYVPDEDDLQDVDDSVAYVIYYHYFDPKYGEIVFSQGVDSQVFGDYQLSELIAKDNPEYAKVYSVNRYVYVYRDEGEIKWTFEDKERTLDEESKIIDPTVKTSSTIYYTVAGILLMAGADLMFIGIVPRRTQEQK
jgi:hypothetical protein